MTLFNLNMPWYLPLILLLAALLVGLLKVRSLWEEMYEDDEPTSDRERLSELEEAHAAGELDADELRRIRELLSRTDGSPMTPPVRMRTPSQAPPEPSPDPMTPDDAPTDRSQPEPE